MNLQSTAALIFISFAIGSSAFCQDDLYTVNQQSGDRTYYLQDGTEFLVQSLGTTGSGTLNVIGEGNGSVLSGVIDEQTHEEGSFFKLTSPESTTLNLKDFTLTNALRNNSSGSVIVVTNNNAANIDSVTVKNSSSASSGGAIYSNNGKLNINSSTFYNNSTANSSAGAIVVYGTDSDTVIDNSVFEKNSA